MATSWQSYQDYQAGSDKDGAKKAVRDIFLPVQRLKTARLQQFFEQVDSLKSPDNQYLLSQTQLPFVKIVGQDSQIFLNTDPSEKAVEDFLNNNFQYIVPSDIIPLMAKDLSARLNILVSLQGTYDATQTTQTGEDVVPDDSITYITRVPSTTDLYRLDLNFIAFAPQGDTAKDACAQTFTLSGLLSTVDRNFVLDNLDSIVRNTYKWLASQDDGTTSYITDIVNELKATPSNMYTYGGIVNTQPKQENTTNPKTQVAGTQVLRTQVAGTQVPRTQVPGRRVPRVPGTDSFYEATKSLHGTTTLFNRAATTPDGSTSTTTNDTPVENTYFIKVPMGTSVSAAKPIQAMFAGHLMHLYPNNTFDVTVNEDDEVRSRLRMTVTLLGQQETSSTTTNKVLSQTELDGFWDSVLAFGQTIVEKAVIPLVIHYFTAA